MTEVLCGNHRGGIAVSRRNQAGSRVKLPDVAGMVGDGGGDKVKVPLGLQREAHTLRGTVSKNLQQAVAKFRRLEKRATELCEELTGFEEEKGREFALSIGESGNRGVWEWTGGDRSLPDDVCLKLGELMVGLRACLDIAVYEMSEHAIACGRVSRNQVSFPCVRESVQWTDRTVHWLDEETRQLVRTVQRFTDRQRHVDCAVIGALAAQDKHRGLLGNS